MKVIDTIIEGVKVIEPEVYKDQRGFFLETFQTYRYNNLLNLELIIVQNTFSLKACPMVKSCVLSDLRISWLDSEPSAFALPSPSGISPISSGLFRMIFHTGMATKVKISAINKAVFRHPRLSGEISTARTGTIANVPTEKPTDPIDIARLRFL